MARSRNIKPGFFKNYELADMGPLAQILFAGLWCLADREGRLEDKPRLIKAEIFPYYDCDVNGELTKLERLGLVVRYEAGGFSVIEVRNFKKHQTPHNTEKASVLPAAPDKTSTESTHSNDNGELTVNPPKSNGGNPPDSLIPDSGFRIPDPLVPADADKPSRAKPKTKLPEDFSPDETGLKKAREAGFDPMEELEKFRDHHTAQGSTMANWQAAYRTWIDKGKNFRRPASNGYAKPAPSATVPGKAERDPELTRLDIERARAVPMPASVREAMAKLKQGAAA